MIHTLRIETLGICTHFTHGVVSGVPHRVVLPDATQIQGGVITISGETTAQYYLIPHFPQIEVSTGIDLTVPGVLLNGDILAGVRLQVVNCVDLEIKYGADRHTPKLTTFDPNYSLSGDVVMNGRAACYFDVYGGRVRHIPPPLHGGASSIAIEMQTEGPPELLVTPLAQWTGGEGTAHRLTLGDDPFITLTVKNVELQGEQPAQDLFGAFDYLLHYLTARGGIPQTIVQTTPGMPSDPPSASAEELANALRDLAGLLDTARETTGRRLLVMKNFLTASCAPAEYP